MNKIAIFYHIWQVGDWKAIVQDQFNKMNESGLLNAAEFIHIGVNGDGVNEIVPIEYFNNNTRVVHNSNLKLGEYDTIKSLHEFCRENKNYAVLYTHTSGVRFSLDPNNFHYKNKTLWRKYQEYFTINHWKKCVSLLETYDCVGTEWKDDSLVNNVFRPDLNHYSGNIWWTTSQYFGNLDWNFFNLNSDLGRHASEFFIGSGNPKHYNFYRSYKDLYFFPIYEEEYRL